jgi:Glycine-rich domain-containing protein-like
MTVFSCDLRQRATQHLQFLREIHHYNTATFRHDVVVVVVDDASKVPVLPFSTTREMECFRRYRDLWLPFVASTTTTTTTSNITTEQQFPPQPLQLPLLLIPPPDVAWLWHCHRLAPQAYTAYCQSKYQGRILEASVPFTFAKPLPPPPNDHHEAAARTEQLWKSKYPQEPFFLSHDDYPTTTATNDDDGENGVDHRINHMNGFDVLGSARRQMAFLWQMSDDSYQSEAFLQQGVQKYHQFLTLTAHAQSRGIILVPTYQIDLMWHTHILSSIHDYQQDCRKIMNRELYHDDSLTDREEGGLLDVSYTATAQLWKDVYGTDYVVPGGMYRGEPPYAYYTKMWSSSSSVPLVSHNHTWQMLVGRVGASSTSSNVFSSTGATPKPWVPLDGHASDGLPAFIRTEQQLKEGIKDLAFRDPYVLCRVKRITGFYHVETKEAQTILYYRMSDRLHDLGIEMLTEKCTCGLWKKNRMAPASVEYKQLKVVCDAMHQQLFGTAASQTGGNSIPPETLFACGGGACGGAVAMKGENHYATACGTLMTTYAGQKLGILGGFAEG